MEAYLFPCRCPTASGGCLILHDDVQLGRISIAHCIDNYVPGILKTAEAHDIAGLIAPRPLFVENGEEDPIFPVEGTRIAFERTRELYRVFRSEESLGLEVFPAKHEFWGRQAFDFIKARL